MLIHNGKLITWNREGENIKEGQALLIKNGDIIEIGENQIMIDKYPQEEKVDAKRQYIMPGNICAHTHFYGAFSRGMAIPGEAPESFPFILKKLWWPLDKSLSIEDVKYSALVCIIDAIKHGTTTLFDHHASPNAIEGSLDEIAKAVEDSGIRASLCYEVTDRDGEGKAEAGINENVRFINYIKKQKPLEGRLNATFGLHASLTLSENTLEKCRNMIPEGAGFHIHVAEHSSDEYDSISKTGLRIVDRLKKHGILGNKTIVAHAVAVDTKEITLLAETGSWVTHQPRSNMNNAVGVAEVESMLRAGINVCLGNDGFTNAMWEEWKAAYFVHKLKNLDPRRMNGYDVIKMAIYNNAALTSQHFNAEIGLIKPGAKADLIFVDYYPFTPLTDGNLPWHILFGFHESMITSTMVNGKFLMKDKKLMTLDEAEISEYAQKLSAETWKRYQKQF